MKLKKHIVGLLTGGILMSVPLYPATIKTPLDLGKWLQREFTYQSELVEYWKTPEETVRDKGGDCEDLSILTSYILNDLGYENQIIWVQGHMIITGGKTTKVKWFSHAICIFKDEEGFFQMFSNEWYYIHQEKSVEDLLTWQYPHWKFYRVCTPQKECSDKILRED